jgi:hypothetical protein
MRASAEPPRHDHHGPAPLERDEGTSSTLRSTTSTTWAASTVGTPSSPRSSRSVTMLFGRLEAPGAPRWADGAVGERRWWERGVSGCAASGSTHCTTSCSWERVPVHVCVLAACSCHSFCASYRPSCRGWSDAIASVLTRLCASVRALHRRVVVPVGGGDGTVV